MWLDYTICVWALTANVSHFELDFMVSLILAHLSMLRVSFLDPMMSFLRVDVHDIQNIRLSTLCLCTRYRGHSFDRIYMKLCHNINLYEI